jgi:hypothetical protein
MDPYLEDEQLWPAFHQELVNNLRASLLPGLLDRYQCRVGYRCYHVEPTSDASAASGERREPYVEIFDRSDGKLTSQIDVVCPANKTTAGGRESYLEKRKEGKAQSASMVEIDLVLQGKPMLEYSREGLPDWDYAVTVTRSTVPDRFEIYTATLQKRLPRFRLPLRSDDRDTVVDLQTLFTRTYDDGGFAAKIDYQRDPVAPLTSEDRLWLDDLLKQQKLRSSDHLSEGTSAGIPGTALSQEKIAVAAYYLWRQEGCQQGRDEEYWQRAIEQLKRL